MTVIWSTDQVPPQDGLAYWVEVVCRTLVPVDCIARGDRPFSSRIEADALGPIRVSVAGGTAQTVLRPQRKIAANPQDDFALAIHRGGAGSFTQLGRDARIGPGDIVLHDMNRPFEFDFPADWTQTILMFPRQALLSRVGDVSSHVAVKLAAGGLTDLLSPLLGSLPSQLHRIPAHARERLAEHLLDLIATAFVASDGPAGESPSMTLARVKLWIERNLAEDLSAESIAVQCRVSSRHLNRLFARENTSLMQFVLERRLARCHRDLADPVARGRSITDIALSAGFNDVSHFSRSYRTRYGCSPKETRAAAR